MPNGLVRRGTGVSKARIARHGRFRAGRVAAPSKGCPRMTLMPRLKGLIAALNKSGRAATVTSVCL